MFKPDVFGWRQSWRSDCWPVRCPRMFARQRPRQRAKPARTMPSGSAATRSRTWREPRRALQKTGAALVRYARPPSRPAVTLRAIIVAGMVEDRGKTCGSLVARITLRSLPATRQSGTCSKRRAVSQPIELLADMSCLRRRVGKRDGAIERHPRLLGPAELEQECAPRAVEVEVAAELARKRLDHGESVGRTADLGDRNSAVERNNRRGLHALQRAVEEIDLGPVRLVGAVGTGVQRSDR